MRSETSIVRSKRRSLDEPEGKPVPKKAKIKPKINPKAFSMSNYRKSVRNILLDKWKILRYGNRKEQSHPRFSGFVFKSYKQDHSQKTFLTYLPPIETPIGDYNTLNEVFTPSEKMAKEANMKYTNITMDCGAAIKAFHVIWNLYTCILNVMYS